MFIVSDWPHIRLRFVITTMLLLTWACGGGGGGGGNITEPPPGGTELYVSTTGDDNNPGTRELPLASIQSAIEAAPRLGADIFVAGGTYTDVQFTMRSKMKLHGGYNPATWTRNLVEFPTLLVTGSQAINSEGADSFSLDGFVQGQQRKITRW